MPTVESLKPATKIQVAMKFVKLFKELGFNVADLSPEEASQVTNTLNLACKNCANGVVDDITKMYKDAAGKVVTFGSATTQQSVESPTEAQGVKFG